VISKGLSLGVIFGALVLKVPVIISMTKNQSAAGLSFAANFTEFIAFICTFGYNFHYGYTASTYIENVFLAIEVLIVITLMWKFKGISFVEFSISWIFAIGLTYGFLANKLPEAFYPWNATLLLALG